MVNFVELLHGQHGDSIITLLPSVEPRAIITTKISTMDITVRV